MLYFILTWTVTTFVCFIIGLWLLSLCRADSLMRLGDRFVMAIWLGLVVLAISFLTASLFLPLSTPMGGAIALTISLLSLLWQRSRRALIAWGSVLCVPLILGFFTTAIAVAALFNQPITWFDTGLYHFSAIRWLSEFGAVPGVALINPKFGFTSSWFALSAVLTPQWLGTQVGAITNGFIFLIAVGHFLIALNQGVSPSRRLSDWFVVAYVPIVLAVYVTTAFAGSPILISFSPDVAITLLVGVIGWAMLVISSQESPKNAAVLDERAVVLILGAGALTIKLTALPLLAIALLFYVGRLSLKRALFGLVLLLVLLLPMVAFSLTTSGCPLFPSRFGCLDLPWTVAGEEAAKEAAAVGGVRKVPWYVWWWNRIVNSLKFQVMFLSLLITTIAILRGVFQKNQHQAWLFVLSLIGMIFILVNAPWLRFGLGYFVLAPALLIARYCQVKFNHWQPFFNHRFSSSRLKKAAGIFVLLFSLSWSAVASDLQESKTHWLMPHRLPQPEMIAAKVNDVNYIYPANWTIKCWAAELPCAPTPRKNIQLRHPSQGIRAGFVRADNFTGLEKSF